MDVLTSSFPRQASSASLIAPLLSVVLYVLLRTQIHGNGIGLFMLGLICLVLLLTGFVLGVMALAQSWHFRATGLFAKALMAAVINGLFVAGMVVGFPWMASGSVLDKLSAQRSIAAGPATNPAVMHDPTVDPARLTTYNQDGIHFSYDQQWTVVDQPEVTNAATGMFFARLVEVTTTEDQDYGLFIASIPFDPSRSNPSLDVCARFILYEALGMRNPPMQHTTGDLGGARLPGVKFHYQFPKHDGSLGTADGEFLLMENPRRRVIVGTVWPATTNRAPVSAVLASIKIDGMNNVVLVKRGDPSKPHVESILYTHTRATALIANKTVGVGDLVAGCRVIAIGQDSVSVESGDGHRKVLQIGDNL